MEPNWAAGHLQVIRTLMERSAIYRRALTPITFLLGSLGVGAAAAGWFGRIETKQGFAVFWLTVSLAAISGAYLVARRQALRDREVFWSPPTRRVTQALLPALMAGALSSMLLILTDRAAPGAAWWLLPLWMTFYGCAIHAAGFFMPRGIKLFGWLFIGIGCAMAAILALLAEVPPLRCAHVVMGVLFGGLHLAYGIYLYFTEPRKNET
jgi:hypothetical protein